MRFWKRKEAGSFSFATWGGRVRTAAPLVAGVVLTVVAVSLARNRIASLEREIRERNEPVEVVVAAEPIPAGGVLSVENLAKRAVPASGAGRRNIRAEEFERILGARVRDDVAPGDPLLWSDLEDAAEGRFSRSIPTGRRAITVDADPRSSFSGLLRPGDRVDILHEREAGAGFRLLLAEVPVLAIDRIDRNAPAGGGPTEVSTLTLSLLPAEAARIANASRNGRVVYLLRNPEDRSRPAPSTRRPGNRIRVEIWKAGLPAGRLVLPGGAG
ncbi:MAG: hypothetical protein Kow00128_19500 [Deltaproteobacteria bacterium]